MPRGGSTRDIAETLVLSEKTVERHRSNIVDKLGLRDRVALTHWPSAAASSSREPLYSVRSRLSSDHGGRLQSGRVRLTRLSVRAYFHAKGPDRDSRRNHRAAFRSGLVRNNRRWVGYASVLMSVGRANLTWFSEVVASRV